LAAIVPLIGWAGASERTKPRQLWGKQMRETAEMPQQVNGLLHTAARVIIAPFFIAKAVGLVVDPNGIGQFLFKNMVPDYMLWPNVAFECLAAFSIMIGLQTRLAAGLLALYLFGSSFLLNFAPGNVEAISVFWRDMALIGGLLLLISHGRGQYSVDNLFAEEAEKQPVLDGDAIEFAPFEMYAAE